MTLTGSQQLKAGGGVNMSTKKKNRPRDSIPNEGTSSGDEKCADESSDLNTSTESVKAVTDYGGRKKKKSNLMTEVMEKSQKASAAATKALVTEMSADNAKMFAGFVDRLVPAAPAAHDPALMRQMQKAQCDAQLSTTTLEKQKLAAHLEEQVEALTAWLEANRSVERLQPLVEHKELRLAACLEHLRTLNGTHL
jgi:hypothetical protein